MNRSTNSLQGPFSGTIAVRKLDDGRFGASSLNHPNMTWIAATEQDAITKARESLTEKMQKGEI